MKTNKTFFFLVLVSIGLLFSSCSTDDEDNDKIDVKVTATLQYEKDGNVLIDQGARICIFNAFEDTKSWVFDEQTYKFTLSNGSIYIHDYMLIMPPTGSIQETIKLDKNASYVYVYVPKVDKAKYEVHALNTNENNLIITKILK